MDIQIDSREKQKAITKIIKEFEDQKIGYYISKLWVGDYMSLDNPRLIIDRKQSLSEVCSNLTQQHKRFRDEAVRAKDRGIQLVILVEHSPYVKSIEDVENWTNPRLRKYCQQHGIPAGKDREKEIAEFVRHGGIRPPTSGLTLSRQMRTMQERYGIRWEFCSKAQTGKRIIEILRDGL